MAPGRFKKTRGFMDILKGIGSGISKVIGTVSQFASPIANVISSVAPGSTLSNIATGIAGFANTANNFVQGVSQAGQQIGQQTMQGMQGAMNTMRGHGPPGPQQIQQGGGGYAPGRPQAPSRVAG